MASKLQIKKSNEAGKVPQVSDLDWGELAINYTDGKLFYKQNGSSSIQEINTPATGAAAHKTWASLGSNGAAARRHTIARVYGTPNHWVDSWQNIRIKVVQEGYSSGYLEYNLIGHYGMGNGNSWLLRLKDADGAETGNFQITLGTVTAAGWDYAGQPTYYQDVYLEVAYYLTVRVAATTYGHAFQTTDPTDGSSGCYTVFYNTPAITDGITYSTASQTSTYHFGNKIWNAGNDGANSGLDADLLDGNDASAFALASHSHSYLPLSGGNLTGALTINSNTVWHAGNDGAGSGLDADSLDGNDASAFALASHSHSYLPLSGGTITGATIIQSSLSVQQYNEASYRKWAYGWGGAQDLNWYRVATLRSSVTDGWRGTSGKITVFDENSNHGVATRSEYTAYFTAHYSSGGTPLDAGYIYFGPGASSYIRLFKVGTRHYEVQVRQIADWKLMGAILEIDEDTGNQSVFETSLQTASTTGTVVASSGNAAEQLNILGNSGTATTLETARTLTIGDTGKTFNGSANVSWTLAEIGAAASSHTHAYLPISGGTMTGTITGSVPNVSGNGDNNVPFQFSQDYSAWASLWAGSSGGSNGWGLFWAGNSGAQYGTNGTGGPGNIWSNSSNPNEAVFVGNGTTDWAVQLGTGNVWQRGDLLINGKLGVGINTPSEKLEVSGNILAFGAGGNTAGSGTNIWLGPSNNSRDIGIRRAGTAIMAFDRYNGGWYENARFHANGNFSIGNATDNGYKLEVNGSFAATTKSFVINHPTKPGKKLRYGSLEGPENGVYVRGRLRGTKIELPDYWTKLVDPDSITVQLTPHGRRQDIWVTKIENNCVYVQGTTQPDCYYFIQAERIDVDKLEVECD